MDLINWSLNEFDTLFLMRSLGLGEPDCPAEPLAAGYLMVVCVVCLATLSIEDIEQDLPIQNHDNRVLADRRTKKAVPQGWPT
ncbi:hypothetical protein Ciccas_013945 [Cichlidogyrus casuarinus]|uniref:Uncharacterized protein n=1 Tax=Cichlidogyrus casuarinus TaxID=1844966 RepID=A0ABD2PJA2_9PLAT